MIPVKICGITKLEDARVAVQYGARAIGFIFWPNSPRCVMPHEAARIMRELPPFVATVGVFVQATVEDMNAVARECRLDRVQLHGGEPFETLAALERPAWRVFRLRSEVDAGNAIRAKDRLLHLDAFHEQLVGGTGQVVNWEWARRVAIAKPVILSGGITAENAVEAVRTVRPMALDVSSGVESAPGIKDHRKLADLFRALAGIPVPANPWSADHALATH
jgi:phosphoribosylanthranilate isomerase